MILLALFLIAFVVEPVESLDVRKRNGDWVSNCVPVLLGVASDVCANHADLCDVPGLRVDRVSIHRLDVHVQMELSLLHDAIVLAKIFGGIVLGSLIFFLAGGWYWERGPLTNWRAFLSLICAGLMTGLLAIALLSI